MQRFEFVRTLRGQRQIVVRTQRAGTRLHRPAGGRVGHRKPQYKRWSKQRPVEQCGVVADTKKNTSSLGYEDKQKRRQSCHETDAADLNDAAEAQESAKQRLNHVKKLSGAQHPSRKRKFETGWEDATKRNVPQENFVPCANGETFAYLDLDALENTAMSGDFFN
ncbi:MAG: hypothetical protein AAGB11_14020 [Pseudomonadota bacterium]